MENLALAEQPPSTVAAPEPEVLPVQAAAWELAAQMHFREWLGSLALSGSAEAGVETEPSVDLLERLRAAKEGSAEARKSVQANIAAATSEAMFKRGHIRDIYMDRTATGEVAQFGQTNDSIYTNAITFRPGRHAVLQKITEAEGLNRHRIEVGAQAGDLKDHYLVAFSLVPNDVPEKELGSDGDGYFLDSLSLSIQATTETPNGRIKTESGFMVGVEAGEDDSFEDRMAKRHDFKAIARLYESFGLEAPRTAQEALARPLLIPEAMMPHGAADVMRWLDIAGDEALGRQVERKAEDYAGLRLESMRREASLKGVQEKVFENLLATTDRLTDAMEAVKLMWRLIKKHGTEESFTNHNIDPKVFGRKAAPIIARVRQNIQDGNLYMLEADKQRAHELSVVTGCGGGSSSSKKDKDLTSESSDSLGKSADQDKFGPREFTCSNGHRNRRPKDKLIDKCQHKGCTAKVKC